MKPAKFAVNDDVKYHGIVVYVTINGKVIVRSTEGIRYYVNPERVFHDVNMEHTVDVLV